MRIAKVLTFLLAGCTLGCLNGNLNSNNWGSGFGVNLETPIEMVDYGLQSNTGAIIFNRTSTLFNPGDYDGNISYAFEIVALNSSASVTYNVSIVDSSSTVLGFIPVPANTVNPTRYRIPWTPNMSPDTYRVKLDLTTASQELKVYSARILVKQTGASRTRIYIPLVGGAYNSASSNDTLFGIVANTTNTSYTGISIGNSAQWVKNSGAFSNIYGWTFEAVLRSSSGMNCYAALWNQTMASPIMASQVFTNSSAVPVVLSMNVPIGAPSFTDFNTITVGLEATSTDTCNLYRAGLSVRLQNLSSGEVYYRLATAISGTSGPLDTGRVYYDGNAFSHPSAYFDVSVATGTGGIYLFDGFSNDSGVGGSVVGGSLLSVATPPLSARVGLSSLFSGDRFIADPQVTGTTYVNPSLVIHFQK